MKNKFKNLTPHSVRLNNGIEILPSGTIARVSVEFTDFDGSIAEQKFGEIENLPEPKDGVIYVVSGFVLAAAKGRDDVVAPATGHPETVRNEKGHIVSVPGFVR